MDFPGFLPKTLTCLVATTMPVLAQDGNQLNIQGRDVSETIFKSIDSNGHGRVDEGELKFFGDSVFVGMDYNNDGDVPYQEFASWDPGFAYIAEEIGKVDAYRTASRVVFAFWDRDGDGVLTKSEMRFAMSSDFRRSDLDGDAFLTQGEFIDGFPIMVAMQAAIEPTQ